MITPQILKLIKEGALVVCDHSAGKDSQAMFAYLKAIVPREQLVVIHAHLPGVEWEGVVEHILATIDGYEYHEVRAGKTFLEMVERRGMWPGAETRQCTSDLKRDPIDKKIRAICKERGFTTVINCMGIRAQESKARSKKNPFKKSNRNSIEGREWYDWYPIFEKSIDWVWNTIAGSFQQPHWAYGAGMTRLSCCFCIMASKSDLQTAAKLRPELLDTYDKLERKINHTMVPPAKGKEPVFLVDYIMYGSVNQTDHSVEELLELAAALLKLKKRGYTDADRQEVVKEFTDVLIQMPIILHNLGIFEEVKAMIPVKINKADQQANTVK